MLVSYLGGGTICTIALAFNPISPELILIFGVGASFGLNAGMLWFPGIVAKRAQKQLDAQPLQPTPGLEWMIAAIVVGFRYVAALAGIHFHR